jgi:rhomboid protease GluP
MEVLNDMGYTEEIGTYELNQNQFMTVVQEAVESLNWFTHNLTEQQIICQTPASTHSQGEIVRITWAQDKAMLHIMPLNEYFWETAQNEHIAASFKQAIATAATEQHKANRSIHPMHREKFGALVISKTYLVTPLIVYSIALVFLAMVLFGVSPVQPKVDTLLSWGGIFRGAVVGGEWWRLITYMFLHSGIMHLLMNTYALLYIGMFLEPLLGKARFISAYLLTGICAGLTSIMMHPWSVGVGASGAIFGMYGVFFSLLTTNHLQRTAKKTMLRSILFFIVFNLFMGMQGNVDNAAHIGGLFSGILMGYAYYPGIRNQVAPKG